MSCTFLSPQYRIARGACSWREWNIHNNSQPNSNGYSLESLFHELLLQSPHRTLDPEEADFFYVPVYASCLAWPVWCVAAPSLLILLSACRPWM